MRWLGEMAYKPNTMINISHKVSFHYSFYCRSDQIALYACLVKKKKSRKEYNIMLTVIDKVEDANVL